MITRIAVCLLVSFALWPAAESFASESDAPEFSGLTFAFRLGGSLTHYQAQEDLTMLPGLLLAPVNIGAFITPELAVLAIMGMTTYVEEGDDYTGIRGRYFVGAIGQYWFPSPDWSWYVAAGPVGQFDEYQVFDFDEGESAFGLDTRVGYTHVDTGLGVSVEAIPALMNGRFTMSLGLVLEWQYL